jgi:hypothetical protein
VIQRLLFSTTSLKQRINKALLALLVVIVSKLVLSLTASAAPSKLITQFPFTLLSGGVVIIQARVAHHLDTLNFVLDTGSGGISLDSTTVADLNLPVVASERTIRGIAGIRKASFVMNESLVLPRLLVDSLNFHINDYSILTSAYGFKIDGIIGYSFLSRYIVRINYDTHTLEVWNQGEIKYPKQGLMLKPYINNIPVFKTVLNDATEVKSRYYFDTGAGLCVLLSERFVKDSSFLKKEKKIIHTQAEGLGGKTPMRLTTIKKVELGKYKFRKVPVYIFDDAYNITAYPQLGGLIGNDLLRRFNLIINYAEGVIHLLPNTHFSEHFDYSYTGLGMYLVDGYIIIEDVIEGSPGEKGGFQPGDIVVSIGTNGSGNIQAYKTLLQTPNARFKIVIRRNGELMVLNLSVASIIRKSR